MIGRWNVVDKSSENYASFSPYAYVGDNPIIRTDPDGNDWRDILTGAAVAVVDNISGGSVNLRGKVSYRNARDFNRGQDVGDVASVVIGGAEAYAGANIVVGGVAVSVGSLGTLAVAGTPAALGGTAMVGHGVATMSMAASNLSSQKGRVDEGSTKGESKGSLGETKKALGEAKEKLGLKPGESLPKVGDGKSKLGGTKRRFKKGIPSGSFTSKRYPRVR